MSSLSELVVGSLVSSDLARNLHATRDVNWLTSDPTCQPAAMLSEALLNIGVSPVAI